MRTLALTISLALAWTAAGVGEAAAQHEDFATCGPDLVACDGETSRCCYRSMNDTDTSTPGAVVIPMDRCHQQLESSGKRSPPDPDPPEWCTSPIGAADDGMYHAYGLVYRLLQNDIDVHWVINPTKDPPALTADQSLTSQTYTERSVDAWVLGAGSSEPPETGEVLSQCGIGCEPPVERLDPNTMIPIAGSYTSGEFPLRGGAFVIAPEDRARFDAFWTKTGEFDKFAGDPDYDFTTVDLYEVSASARFVYQDFRAYDGAKYAIANGGDSAPIAITLDYDPPRLARQSPAGVSEVWLANAKLLDPADNPDCLTGEFKPADAVFCDITEDQIEQGYLIDGDFRWAWLDNYKDNSPCGSDAEIEKHSKLHEFLTEEPGVRPSGNVMLMEAAVGVAEGCTDYEFMGLKGTGITALKKSPGEPMILRHPHNLFMQWGDLPSNFASGSVGKWQYYGNGALGYDPSHLGADGTLVRLLTEDKFGSDNTLCTDHVSTPSCDVLDDRLDADIIDMGAYLRYQDDPRNGVVFYMGGNNVNPRPSHQRMILNSFISLPSGLNSAAAGSPVEVARSSPIVAAVDGVQAQYQGTYVNHDPKEPVTTYTGAADADTFQFPYRRGHFRAIPTETISETGTSFDESDAIFDAANEIPPPVTAGCGTPFTGSCRSVFTNVAAGARPDRVLFDTSNVERIRPLLAPGLTVAENETLISRVLAGYDDGSGRYVPKLGGIDRSTAAVIEPSPMVGNVRPTIAYVGAHDGMLHAICADTVGPCDAKGQELWAFLPRTQLPVLKDNTQRIDGSPKVSDVFGDFDGDGIRQWRTVLTLQTGSGKAGFKGKQPAVYALDVTDPGDPRILWEVTTRADRRAIDLGVGVGLAMGRVRIDGSLQHATFVQTNNGGTGGPGFYLAAVDTETGELLWEQGRLYPAPRLEGNPLVPATGIPGGVAAVDGDETGNITELVVPSLYGEMWLIDAATGDNRLAGTGRPLAETPLFQFETDHHPIGASPTIYRDRATGTLYAVGVSGGYVDPVGSSWAPADVDQYAVAVSLDTPPGSAPVTESSSSGELRAFAVNVGTNRAYAQAVVVGNELFVITDTDDVNASSYGMSGAETGVLSRFALGSSNFAAGEQLSSDEIIGGGAGSVDATAEGVVFSGSGQTAEKTDYSADHDGDGADITSQVTQGGKRKLWLRTQ